MKTYFDGEEETPAVETTDAPADGDTQPEGEAAPSEAPAEAPTETPAPAA